MKLVCPCCSIELEPDMHYCPVCLITLLKPDDYEEVIEDGNYRSSGS